MVMIDGWVWERAKTVYLSQEFKMAIFTGQKLLSNKPTILLKDYQSGEEIIIKPHYEKNKALEISGERVHRCASSFAIPFNALSKGQLEYCQSIAEPISLIEIEYDTKRRDVVTIIDQCTGEVSSIPAAALDRDVVEAKNGSSKPPRIIV
jgi:hypothetical protein